MFWGMVLYVVDEIHLPHPKLTFFTCPDVYQPFDRHYSELPQLVSRSFDSGEGRLGSGKSLELKARILVKSTGELPGSVQRIKPSVRCSNKDALNLVTHAFQT